MKSRLITGLVTIAAIAWAGLADAQSARAAPADPWPRQITVRDATVLVYQPQVESWTANVLDFRSAVAIRTTASKQETFGVVWATARTRVDRVSRIVALEDLQLTRSHFPTLADDGAAYVDALRREFGPGQRTIGLDRLEASLAASASVKPLALAVSNTPPRIIVSESPAVLVPIDGAPVWRFVSGTSFERVINTRALIVREQGTGTLFLHVYDGWLSSNAVTGPWQPSAFVPPTAASIARQLSAAGQVDLLDGGDVKPKPSLAQGAPTISVSETPAELIVFRGAPMLEFIPGTALQWVSNTNADVIYDTAGREYYTLVSGRWYRSPGLGGSWSYVDSTALPPDFARIPPTTPAGVVLASVAGTPQAQEAVIANSIPQTADIPRVNGPKFTPVFDGTPEMRPIEGTALEYVVNSPTPIIHVSAGAYYALRAGVWFRGGALTGPWYVAASVPAAIYAIPVTSPLHYVTYVQVYGSTAQTVYVGYTPGYLGTVVSPAGVVVYGTGYAYTPWIGSAWYPSPATYGVVAQPIYNPAVGMAFGFAMGMTTAAITGAYYHPGYYPVYHGYPCCGTTSANVYGAYGSTTWSGTRSYYSSSSGYGQSASGSYTNYRTGTTGTYSASRSVNYAAGTAQQSTGRTFNTPYGSTGSVAHSETYNANTGRYSYASGATATGPGGTTVTSSRATGPTAAGGTGTQRTTTETNPTTGVTRSITATAGAGPQGAGAERQTTYSDGRTGATATVDRGAGTGVQGTGRGAQMTYSNPATGQTRTYGAGREGNTAYADNDGNVYRNSGSGWQQRTASGWQAASGDTSWADREQQARAQGEDRFNGFSQSGAWGGGGGWGNRFGGAAGGWGNRFAGGGWGNRFAGGGWGGGWGDRFGGAGRFGGGRWR